MEQWETTWNTLSRTGWSKHFQHTPWRISPKGSSSSCWEQSKISYLQLTNRLVSCLTPALMLVSVRFWELFMTSFKKFHSPMETTETLASLAKSLWGGRDQAWSSTQSISWNSSTLWSLKFKTRLVSLDYFSARRMLDFFTRKKNQESKRQEIRQWPKRMETMQWSWVVGPRQWKALWGTICYHHPPKQMRQ